MYISEGVVPPPTHDKPLKGFLLAPPPPGKTSILCPPCHPSQAPLPIRQLVFRKVRFCVCPLTMYLPPIKRANHQYYCCEYMKSIVQLYLYITFIFNMLSFVSHKAVFFCLSSKRHHRPIYMVLVCYWMAACGLVVLPGHTVS